MIRHHLDDDILVRYAAGSLEEGWSIGVATHLALCPECRGRLQMFEALGGHFLESEIVEDVSDDEWQKMRRLISADETGTVVQLKPKRHGDGLIPEPLQAYVDRAGGLKWRRLGGGAAQMIVPTDDSTTTVRLLKIPAGKPVPEHSHGGTELTLVLDGSFSDELSSFKRGDVEMADAEILHTPRADPGKDCICLAITDAPLKFTSRFVRWLQPWLKI
jgi:putative transcriptional regulator